MKWLIVGIDIGASITKAAALEESRIVGLKSIRTLGILDSAQVILKEILQDMGREYMDINRIAISGGGARLIGDTLLGLPAVKVDEIKAIGLGGLTLSDKQQALIVSMGTGTALVIASEKGRKIKHIGGTGVGGGTIEGLSRWMLGTDKFEVIEEMANRGSAGKVDLTVADITGGPVGIVPGDATASNFGRLNVGADKNDIAAAIFNMVSQVIGVIAAMAAKAYHLEEDVVLVGKLIQSKKIAEIMHDVARIFQIKICIPEDGEYFVAIGAAKSII